MHSLLSIQIAPTWSHWLDSSQLAVAAVLLDLDPAHQLDAVARRDLDAGAAIDAVVRLINGTAAEQRARLLLYQDQIKVRFDREPGGRPLLVRPHRKPSSQGAQVDYNGSPPATNPVYPEEAITYVEAHDNETLFDAYAGQAPGDQTRPGAQGRTSSGSRPARSARAAVLRRGHRDPPLEVDGQELLQLGRLVQPPVLGLLRQRLRAGLPPAGDTGSRYPYLEPLLANAAIKPTPAEIPGRRSASASCSRPGAAPACSASATPQRDRPSPHVRERGPVAGRGARSVTTLSDEVRLDLYPDAGVDRRPSSTRCWATQTLYRRGAARAPVQAPQDGSGRPTTSPTDDGAVRARPGALLIPAADDCGVPVEE